jgi:hypothetical protein
MDPILGYVVTGFGFVLAALSFAVIFLGKRIPGDSGSKQQLEFKGFKAKTDGVVMLLVVSVIVAVLPICLQGWLASREPAHRSAPESIAHIFITGQVLDANGPVEGAVVTVTNMRAVEPGGQAFSIEPRVTDSSGTFDFPELRFNVGDRYRVVAAKRDHIEQYFYIGPGGAVDVRAVLVAKRSG